MKFQKFILMFFLLFFLVSQASAICELADADIGTYVQGSCVGLWQTCPDCSFVNISQVLAPNSSVISTNLQMTQISTSYNYTFCSTDAIGSYVYKTYGNSSANGICTQNINFHVTPNGQLAETPKAILYFGIILILLVIFVVMMWAHMGDRSPIWRVWWFSAIWIWLVAITFIGYRTAQDFIGIGDGASLFLFLIWQILMYGFPFYLLICLGYTGYWIWKQREVQELMMRGFSETDARNYISDRGGR